MPDPLALGGVASSFANTMSKLKAPECGTIEELAARRYLQRRAAAGSGGRRHTVFAADVQRLGSDNGSAGGANWPVGSSLVLPEHVHSNASSRRESFLYKPELIGPASKHESSSNARASPSTSACSIDSFIQHGDDLIVTPFAQILANLRSARNKFAQLRTVDEDESEKQVSLDALHELDWCLEQLDSIQTHRSVADMASNKFRRMLSRELSHFVEEGKSGSQISDFIQSTFMDRDEDLELPIPTTVAEDDESGGSEECNQSSGAKPSNLVSNVMSKAISGVRRFRQSNSVPHIGDALPPFGVDTPHQAKLQQAMERLCEWELDIFQVCALSNEHPLTAVTYTALQKRGLVKSLRLPPSVLVAFLAHLELLYRPNPYHNQTHGADVVQSINVLLCARQLRDVFSELEQLAALVAGAMHDADHPGRTNQFLINSGHELALFYNDQSVLEHHHLAVAFQLLQRPACDFLAAMPRKQRQTFRRIAIDMVLATDMSKHMSLLADLKTTVEAKRVGGSGVLLLDNYSDRVQVLQNMIHLADLANPCKPLPVYQEWVRRIMDEYWRQGDEERRLGLDVSPMCDRHCATVERSQLGFIDFIVHPLWETWADLVHPDAQPMLDCLQRNRDWYAAQQPPLPLNADAHS